MAVLLLFLIGGPAITLFGSCWVGKDWNEDKSKGGVYRACSWFGAVNAIVVLSLYIWLILGILLVRHGWVENEGIRVLWTLPNPTLQRLEPLGLVLFSVGLSLLINYKIIRWFAAKQVATPASEASTA